MGFIILVVALFLVALLGVGGYYLYIIMQEQREIVQVTDKDVIRNVPDERMQASQAVNDSNFDTLLTHAAGSLDKLDELREVIQSDLRKAVKDKNIARSRECNKYLKKLDEIERSKHG